MHLTPLTRFRSAAAVMILAFLAPVLFAQTTSALPDNHGFTTVKQLLARSCAQCHDWTGSRDAIMANGRVIASKPDESILYQKISDDSMPPSGTKLSADEKAFIKGWISMGAPETDMPISVPAAEDATSGATTSTSEQSPATPFLGFPSKTAFHEVTGFTSTALFTAAGVIGVLRYLDMKNQAHPNGTEGESEAGENSISGMITIWKSDQALRWWHVGLVSAGEVFYLGDAITGLTMFTNQTPGKVNKNDIHRYAFFTHATLMAAQVVLGFLDTDAFANGRHDQSIYLTGAHALIGIAIPAVMLYSGLENVLP